MRKFMFDTNAFSSLLASHVDWSAFFSAHKNEFEFFITAVQVEELAKIPDKDMENRIRHLLCLCCMNVKLVPTIGVVGKSRLGLCILGNRQDMYAQLLNENRSNISDAMIGDAAYREGCTLITDDRKFINKLNAAQIPTMTFQEFCESIGLGV